MSSKRHLQPPPWEPDRTSTSCRQCDKTFSISTRRHHCRACGRLFCKRCTSTRLVLERYGFKKPVRVCSSCRHKEALRRGAARTFLHDHLVYLRDGIEVIKHEREGLPQRRLMFLSPNCEKLLWTELVDDISRRGSVAKMFQTIHVRDIIRVDEGMSDAVFKNSGSQLKKHLYISIISIRETIDIEATTFRDESMILNALNSLLEAQRFVDEERCGWDGLQVYLLRGIGLEDEVFSDHVEKDDD
eukprot:TRINITY_DN82738_c0_g1_i1.p1 TRINITY_DN82738_c0_g1~~TRINITY_DN82738_c0_g1_i1.p1  ORF type:complete len:244 (+),score=47.09 TRINITY_DN82738_c0_g1_i1:57-788(+)